MATIKKIQASLYAISKRLQGYHLLKNPKGTSPTEVNMIKQNFHGTSQYWDDIFHITRIRKTFSGSGEQNEKRFLMSTHYMDVEKLEMTRPRQKDINYSVKRNDEYFVLKNREDLSFEEAENRKVPKLSYERSSIFEEDSEYDTIYRKKRIDEWDRGYYKQHYSLLSKILSLGLYKKMLYPTENRPNFFKVLYQNLTNTPREQKMI